MKRTLAVILAIGVVSFLVTRGRVEPPNPVTATAESVKPFETTTAALPQKRAAETNSATGKPTGNSLVPARNGKEVVESPSGTLDQAIGRVGTTGDMSGEKENWFALSRNNMGENVRHLMGRVTIAYRGHEGKFTVQFLIPAVINPSIGIPIFMADEKKPAINFLGTAGLQDADSENALPAANFAGSSLQPFFSKKPGTEPVAPKEAPANMTTVNFAFDPSKKKGTAPVTVRFGYEGKGPTTVVGKLDYVIAN